MGASTVIPTTTVRDELPSGDMEPIDDDDDDDSSINPDREGEEY